MKQCITTAILLLSVTGGFSQSLPDFTFTGIQGETVTAETLPEGKPIIVFYFDPYCAVCLEQAARISAESATFKDVTMLWVAYGADVEAEAFISFRDTYLKDAKNVYICTDYNYMFDTWFGYTEAITLYVYNTEWKRIAQFNHPVTAAALYNSLGQ